MDSQASEGGDYVRRHNQSRHIEKSSRGALYLRSTSKHAFLRITVGIVPRIAELSAGCGMDGRSVASFRLSVSYLGDLSRIHVTRNAQQV